jgi:hypothetical protein
MSAAEDRERQRMLTRLRTHFARRRSPRATITVILLATGTAGFVASVLLLKGGVLQMWLRYPLAVLLAWAVFLALVRAWAERERENFRLDEHLGEITPPENDPSVANQPDGESVFDQPRPKRAWRWLDWLDVPDIGLDAEGCLVGIAFAVLVAALVGAVVAVAGLIGEAEIVLAEVFLDAILVSALYRRLSRLQPRWWLAGALRQTVWPVLFTTIFLVGIALIFQQEVPAAKSAGEIWRHYFPKPLREPAR